MKLVAIRIRGLINIKHDIKETMKYLNLNKKHTCVIVENNPINKGMLVKVKDYITWGELDEETEKLLLSKRKGSTSKDNVFRLAPPIGGFERKGVKKSFLQGGVLGNRAEKINILLKKMIQ